MRLSSLRGFAFATAIVSVANCDCGEVLDAIPVPEVGILNEAGDVHVDADPWMVVDFGDADTNQSVAHTLKVKNIGGGTLHISQVCLVNAVDEATAVRADTACLGNGAAPFVFPTIIGTELKADATVDLPVTFKPVAGGPASVFLRIGSDAADEPLAAVQLTGRGTDGTLCADPVTVDFGDVVVGESKTLPVTISNCGIKPVSIDTASVNPNPDGAFVAIKDGVALAAPIGPLEGGDSFVVDVTFTPTQVGPYRDVRGGAIQLETAAPFANLYVIPLLGNGIDRPACRVNVVPQVINFGGVASNTTQTRQLIVQSVGQCACQLTGFTGPTAVAPTTDGLFTAVAPALPVVLKGTTGCDDDPAGAATAPSVLTVDVSYAAPDRQTPVVDRATIEVTTDAEVEPVRTISLEANGGGAPFCQIDVTPRAPTGGFSQFGASGRIGLVEFGRTSIHIAKRQPIVVSNIGNTVCNVSDVAYAEEANTLANEFRLEDDAGNNGVNVPAFALQPGQSKTFFAIFAPTHTVQADPNNPLDLFSFGSYSGSLGTNGTGGPFACGFTGPNSRCNGVVFTTDDTVTEQPPEDDITGRFSVGFSGTPVEPSVDVIPPELDFGLVTLDCGSPERRTTLYNTGSLPLVVGQPVVDPVTNPAVFQVTATSNPGDNPTNTTSGWPYTIQPGDSLSIAVRYFARALDVQTALLVVPTFEDDNGQQVDGPPVTVPLLGEGTLERSQVDIFDQASEPTVDVLFVIDDSASMQDDVDQLANNFPQFFTASGVRNANFHLAVTTTLNVQEPCTDLQGNCPDDDMSGYSTSCTGSNRILTNANADADDQFQCNARVYDTSNVNPSRTQSSVEGGLRAAYNFLSPPNITDPAINGGFLRDEAKLHVIIVSDEVDSSRGPTDLYVDFFQNLKGFRNSSLVAVSAIAMRAGETCGDGTGDARYEEVVDAMNGRFGSICDQDWEGIMSSLGLDSLGLQVEFFLTRAATESTLSVCVRNGSTTAACTPATQVQGPGATGYFYDDVNNSIVFNAGSVPSRGSRVEVTYETFCFQ